MAEDAAVREALLSYLASFTSFDVGRICDHFHDPCSLVTARGVQVLASGPVIRDAVSTLVNSLRIRGIERTEYVQLVTSRLGDGLALARAIARRSAADGREIERIGVTYILRPAREGWRIAVLAVHEPVEP